MNKTSIFDNKNLASAASVASKKQNKTYVFIDNATGKYITTAAEVKVSSLTPTIVPEVDPSIISKNAFVNVKR